MKRLFSAGVLVSLLVMGASILGAETTVKGSKSNTSERVAGSGKSQAKGTKSTTAPASQDPCENVKNDPQQYAKCQDATHPIGLKQPTRRGGGY
ncbi:MAG: hypothetical protein C3F12_06050 [Candidatus Methylomirabilota bacterium]|nr:hypothetical protein [Candidatus Methylomirabilis sp.]NJD69577.1 hypothetical protein [candidate division NC10 bacterium]PWB47526.1 MAG: hypothetical protein C3F12_06050 [candidate division NC10 bacterium]